MTSPNAETVALIDALRKISADMHNTSTRPCGTCQNITKVLGEAFGCLAYQRQPWVSPIGRSGT